MIEYVKGFMPGALVQGSRSTVLHSLGYLAAFLMTSIAIMVALKGPDWIVQYLFYLLIVVVAVYLLGWVYFAFKNPDALRSESYGIQKMAIERGAIGDNISGMFSAARVVNATDASDISNLQISSRNTTENKP